MSGRSRRGDAQASCGPAPRLPPPAHDPRRPPPCLAEMVSAGLGHLGKRWAQNPTHRRDGPKILPIECSGRRRPLPRRTPSRRLTPWPRRRRSARDVGKTRAPAPLTKSYHRDVRPLTARAPLRCLIFSSCENDGRGMRGAGAMSVAYNSRYRIPSPCLLRSPFAQDGEIKDRRGAPPPARPGSSRA